MNISLRLTCALGTVVLALTACGNGGSNDAVSVVPTTGTTPMPTPASTPTPPPITSVTTTVVATFVAPWSMAFLPDGRMLVTERPPTPTTLANPVEAGRLRLVTVGGTVSDPISGLPANVGLFDIKLDPQYTANHRIYVSFMERDPSAQRNGRNAGDASVDPAGLAVARAVLTISAAGVPQISEATVIWRQLPKIASNPGSGEPGGRMTFSTDGAYLFVAAGDRQEISSYIQNLDNTLGKIIRINPDGTVPSDNPFVGRAGALGEIWSVGHRNQYGLAFNAAGELWENEMGPKGGDELNQIQRGSNYGWPLVSYGDNYDGSLITKPAAGDGFAMAAYFWTPVIAPSDMIFYSGTMFADWRGDALISGLQSQGLVRVRFTSTTATEVQRIPLGTRIRAVQQGPDGAIWVLEDQPSGRLLKLAPIFGS